MVERLHRQLKAAIKCHDTSNWVDILPIDLLGIRTAIKEDLNATAAEMVYGTGIRLPAEFFIPTKQQANSEFASRLKDRIGKIRPHPITRHGEKRTFVFRDLETSPYVFLRRDAIGDPLQPPYDGPYQTRRDIVVESSNKYVYCRPCDLASQKKHKKRKLHILINNAGVIRCPKMYTQEGIELQFGVNHIGHLLLTNLLLDTLKDSAPSRIVNVSSSAHKRGKIKFDDLNNEKTYEPGEAYAQSKLANILFTKELANKLKGTGVTVNAVHPGIVRTEITRYMGIYQNFLGRLAVDTLY
ncbi:retinol dehydrogenase 13-like [Bombus vosnesenskii]|uniref:Retinol dehydrogenase 13-like n=3 Tax=Bombus vosnesenskii TaxID=207650 RepID=A0A6J3L6K1_9HYME|nr:retinol dehydrogenase 13-like [Bombus vosnesenskii]XP_033362399.1 retinol dehydrogenase 13-like [Bombus vosnesenskii]XP_033363282.1 retinol dehydrogenase 13-like [Bombus vosnesenskii]